MLAQSFTQLLLLFPLLLFLTQSVAPAAPIDGGARTWRVACVADLDKRSKDAAAKKPRWRSLLQLGTLSLDVELGRYELQWEAEQRELFTALGEAGRGAEFSELAAFGGEVLTVCDRTGAVFAVPPAALSAGGCGAEAWAVPRHIVSEGDGSSPKGLKAEWATVKDGELYIGSFGKPFTTPDGERVTSNGTLWVARISRTGCMAREDWGPRYRLLNEATDTQHPGYMIIEAIEWDEATRQWVVMPRRLSPGGAKYDEVLDETRGTDVVLWVDEAWGRVTAQRRVGELIPLRGASSFKLVPGTGGRVAVVLKTEEEEAKGTQATYASVVDLVSGELLVADAPLPVAAKFEGVLLLPHAAAGGSGGECVA